MTTGFKAFIQGMPSDEIRREKQIVEQRKRAEYIFRQLKESERILNILRPIPAMPQRREQDTIQKFMKHMAESRPVAFQDHTGEPLVVDPCSYFDQRFPDQIKNWGPAFFGSDIFFDGRRVFIADAINEDAMAAILGGEHRIGHQVVWCPREDMFYFHDFRVEAFCPTTEAKLGLLASNWTIRCSQECHPLSARALLKLRTPQSIKGVITAAKAMLEADEHFFHGKNGNRRYVDGRYIETNDQPSYKLFVRKAIVREPSAKLTMGNAFHRYYQFCKENAMTPLTRQDFKNLVSEVIREEYNLGLRHDVLDERGKQTHGWFGIDCSLNTSQRDGSN